MYLSERFIKKLKKSSILDDIESVADMIDYVREKNNKIQKSNSNRSK